MGTWALTALGAATVIFFKKPGEKLLNLMLGFAAGVMIAASFWSLLGPAVEMAREHGGLPPWFVATAGFVLGAVFIWASDKIIAKSMQQISGRTGAAQEGVRPGRAALLILSITLHNIPEGLAVGVAFGALRAQGMTADALMGALSIALGIGLQNFPEGAAVSLPLRREGLSRAKSFALGQASGMVEPVAGVLGALLVVYMQAVLPLALAFAAGAMILVAVHELIPACQENRSAQQQYLATAGIIAGFATMTLLDVLLG